MTLHAVSPLSRLHLDIDRRVDAIRAAHSDWPCGKGCDDCCRRLAGVPRLTAGEWALLRSGLEALDASRLREIRQRIAALGDAPAAPLTCPMLDRESGACPVYAQRPVACRTYGFYVQRDLGLYCSDIEASAARGVLADVIWGNQDAIDRALAVDGEARSLSEWFAHWHGSP
ncbi:YkgJ family cysteine cluster protein [Thauera linaloolentis]|uniref:YkgJ family cysteine cluster protein n=1 Tax=Thauera linaloolentis (strain DSM 12138 / JCM 21573 / CCUG 41526 / CIP 105981 / IAM 15112 / NBRC 102519 / 47Lol) TaxID=1123367 RepID=N6YDE0_THAL4|nr:YkgJ family cysteine cluster protein [Thauera linaloolentis]ENO89555.1 hypothetical protein C666_05865 [Thauera linaloolentis 47Lol = DSM 12138]MCM8565449.1 YkgJ family cysteine cluster protein [Thauera linaloolentis]